MVAELGRTRLDTRRDRTRRMTTAGIVLAGALLCAWIAAAVASWVSGSGWQWPALGLQPVTTGGSGGLLGLPKASQPEPTQPTQAQFPVTLSWPAPVWATVLTAAPLWAGWMRLVVRPLWRGLGTETRHRGLAGLSQIRTRLSASSVRSAGKVTRPGLAVWWRWLLAPSEFGYHLGRPVRPHDRRGLWADWEQRMRILARTGWGKTSRLLVPIIRTLPGPAVISSTEPAIFEQTVHARQHRRTRLRWPWLDLVMRRWLPVHEYPVAVVDFSPPHARYAAGYRRVQWNPIDGCADFDIAYRRAAALLIGTESTESDRGSSQDWIFRESATDVLTAWLHAADLGDCEVTDVAEWLRDTSEGHPLRILDDHPRADPSAAEALRKHLDSRSEKTTASVERFLALAMRSMLSADGRELCGQRFTAEGKPNPETFDMTGFIEDGGTVYVLADAQRIERPRPLLSLFANEMFFAAEQAALRRPGRKRLPQPFTGVLDELRYGVPISALPYIGNAMRKFGIGYIYAIQESGQETTLYGSEASALRAAAGISLYGGIDIDSARELSDRAGTTPVVTATRGDHDSEQIQHQQALTIADQQELADGESVVSARGLRPFVAHTPLIYDHRRQARRIEREASEVSASVAAARARQQAQQDSQRGAAAAGAEFT